MSLAPSAVASLRAWLRRVWETFAPSRSAQDIEDELQAHVALAAEEARHAGAEPTAVAPAARRRAGAVPQAMEAMRDQQALPWVRDLGRDLRYGVRMLRRSPMFATAAIASLALGIGATTAIFGLMDAVMLRTLPVRNPERLVQLTRERPPYGRVTLSYPMYAQLRDGLSTLDGVLAQAWLGSRNVVIDAVPEPVLVELVSGNYYTVLGVDAGIGRVFGADADVAGAPAEAVLSHGFWQRRFGADPSVVGRTFRVNDTPVTIVGVMPRRFLGATVGRVADVSLPLVMDGVVRGTPSWRDGPHYAWLDVMGRLRDGRSVALAQAEANAVMAGLNAAEAEGREANRRAEILAQTITLRPAGGGFDDLSRQFARPLQVLMAVVTLLLLMASANLANLLLARAAARQPEVALRQALGASRGRVVRQLLAEGVLLAILGGALGVALAHWLANGLVTVMSNGPARIPLAISIDGRLLGFTSVAALASCVLFSLAPTVQLARNDTRAALGSGRVTRHWRLGPGLIATQVAIAVLLLVGAGLFGRTLWTLYTFDAGFARQGVLLISIPAPRDSDAGDRLTDLQARVVDELAALPGATSASLTLLPPISGGGWDGQIVMEGHQGDAASSMRTHLNAVGPHYFATLGTPLVSGREFTERDRASSTPVALVNEAFVRQQGGERAVLGRRVGGGDFGDDWFEVVGIVKDMRYQTLRQTVPPTVFFALRQSSLAHQANTYVVKTSVADATRAALPATLARIDPALTPSSMQTIGEHVARSVLNERILAMLSGCVGALSLLLVSVGVYGAVAFQVARRTKEIGVRLALGGRPLQVLGGILRAAMRPVVAGCIVGLVSALVLTRVAEAMLFGVAPTDVATFAAASGVLAAVALFAAWMPARRAIRVSPAVTLRRS